MNVAGGPALIRGMLCAIALNAGGVSFGGSPDVAVLGAGERTSDVWVYFRDKGYHGADLDRALADLVAVSNPRMIQRRQYRRTDPGLVDERDLPLNGRYVESVLAGGAVERTRSRWLNALSVRATAEQLSRIVADGNVLRVEPVRGGSRRVDGMAEGDVALSGGPYAGRDFYGRASAQLNQINLVGLHQAGYNGTGVVIGILDTGFLRTHAAFNQPGRVIRVLAEHDFVSNDSDASFNANDHPDQHRHGTWILSTIGSNYPDEMVGGAYGASFVLAKTEDVASETPVEEDYYVAGLEFIEMNGGDLSTSSLGYSDWYTSAQLNGVTAVTSIAVNIAGVNGLHCVTAAGNGGHDSDPGTNTLGAPADAFNVITCGAVAINGDTAGFSSDGPSADGRVKPELLAMGVNTAVVSSRNDTGFGTVSGTSLSTPLVAAAVACLVQAHPNWTVEKLRNQLIYSASESNGVGAFDPLYIRGHGLVNALQAHLNNCPADTNGDRGVGIEDLLQYLGLYEQGRAAADLDDGTSSGNPDGGVGVEDLLYFLVRYDGGC